MVIWFFNAAFTLPMLSKLKGIEHKGERRSNLPDFPYNGALKMGKAGRGVHSS